MATYSDLRYPLSERTTIVDEKQTNKNQKQTNKKVSYAKSKRSNDFIYLFIFNWLHS